MAIHKTYTEISDIDSTYSKIEIQNEPTTSIFVDWSFFLKENNIV